MKSKSHRVWLYDIGLLETLNFYHERNVYWFRTLRNNRLAYSVYFDEDVLSIYKKLDNPI